MAMLNLRAGRARRCWSTSRASPNSTPSASSTARIEVGAAVTQNRLLAWPAARAQAAAAGGGTAVRRPLPDPQQGHGLRLDRACRPELGNSAVARGARRRGGAALASAARACSPPTTSSIDMLTTAREPRRTDHRGALSGRTSRAASAFREVARRHGDFAIVAVAAVVEDASSIRLGVGGMADRPAVRRIEADGGRHHATRSSSWPGELEGYEDLHASAAHAARPPAPPRAGRHRGGQAMRRVNKDERARITPDAQRPQAVGARPSRACCSAISCASRSARPAPMSAASTASAAAARCCSTARRCARA